MNLLGSFRSMLTQSSTTMVLTHQGAPVSAPVKVLRWQVDSDVTHERMRTTVEFGPFADDAEFDGALIDIGTGVEPTSFGSLVRLAAGMTFSYDIEFQFTRDA